MARKDFPLQGGHKGSEITFVIVSENREENMKIFSVWGCFLVVHSHLGFLLRLCFADLKTEEGYYDNTNVRKSTAWCTVSRSGAAT